jgi:hypothetical protein
VRITVTSTAARVDGSTIARCVRSVQMQSFVNRRHVYFLADAQDADLVRFAGLAGPATEIRRGVYPNAPELANLWPLWRSLPDDEIVVWLDGDDFLATPFALEIVARAHAEGAVATYGQFMWADGSIGFAAPVGSDPRREPWRATHLKTFRAGLLKRLREQDLKTPDGAWTFITDQPVMLPVLELAGRHARFIPNILCVYTVANLGAELSRHDPAYVWRQRAELERVRALPRYAPLNSAQYAEIIGGRGVRP